MTNKYKLTDNTKKVHGRTLYQIKALKDFGEVDFGEVKKGDLGGWIENYNNLSQKGTAWVYNDAMVFEEAMILGSAQVYDNSHVWGNAKVYGNAQVRDHAWIWNNALVYGNAHIWGNALIGDKSQVFEDASVYGATTVCGNAKVYGDSKIQGNIYIRENDEIKGNKSYLIFNNTWSSGRQFIYVLSNHRWHVGCFDGTGEELIKKAYQDSELSGKMYELYVRLAEQVTEAQQRNKGLDNVQ